LIGSEQYDCGAAGRRHESVSKGIMPGLQGPPVLRICMCASDSVALLVQAFGSLPGTDPYDRRGQQDPVPRAFGPKRSFEIGLADNRNARQS